MQWRFPGRGLHAASRQAAQARRRRVIRLAAEPLEPRRLLAAVWARPLGNAESGNQVARFADGSTIVAGSFSGTGTFGRFSLTSRGESDIFVAKLAADGTVAWATQAGGTSMDSGYGIAACADGSAIVTGFFMETASFGGFQLTDVSGGDVFIAKITADGSFAWARQAGGDAEAWGNRVATFADGSAIVTGGFIAAAADFGGTSAGNFTVSSKVFVARLTPAGAFSWVRWGSAPDTGSIDVRGVAALGDGTTLVAGSFSGAAHIGPWHFDSVGGSSDIFVARLGVDGGVEWVRRTGGSGEDAADALAAGPDGTAVITGTFSGTLAFDPRAGQVSISTTDAGGDAFVARLSSADGRYDWATRFGGPGTEQGRGVSVRPNGQAVVVGRFTGPAQFGGVSLTRAGEGIFVATLTSAGAFASAASAGTGSLDVHAVAAAADGSAVVVGSYEGAVTVGGTSPVNAGDAGAFVARFDLVDFTSLRTVGGVEFGTTAAGYALRVDGRVLPILRSNGTPASGTNPGGNWVAQAARRSGAGYEVFWRNPGSGQFSIWQLSAAAVQQGSRTPTLAEMRTIETQVGFDLTGDGIVGVPFTPLRNAAGVEFGTTAAGYALRVNGRVMQITRSNGSVATAANPGGGWVADGARASGAGYEAFWKHPRSGQFRVWRLSGSAAEQSSRAATRAEMQSIESQVGFDITGDGVVGVPVPAEANWYVGTWIGTIPANGNTATLTMTRLSTRVLGSGQTAHRVRAEVVVQGETVRGRNQIEMEFIPADWNTALNRWVRNSFFWQWRNSEQGVPGTLENRISDMTGGVRWVPMFSPQTILYPPETGLSGSAPGLGSSVRWRRA